MNIKNCRSFFTEEKTWETLIARVVLLNSGMENRGAFSPMKNNIIPFHERSAEWAKCTKEYKNVLKLYITFAISLYRAIQFIYDYMVLFHILKK